MKSVKFGNRKALEIIDIDTKNTVKKYFWDKSRIRITDKNYRILNYNTLHHLNKYPHLVSLSTYGKKFLLGLIQVDDRNQTLFIDKKKEMMIYMPMNFADSLYQGTIFDGELIKDNQGKWYYFISDIYLYKGKPTFKIILEDRIKLVKKILEKDFKESDVDFCKFIMKEYFPYQYLEDLCNSYVDTLPYKCSGIVFKN